MKLLHLLPLLLLSGCAATARCHGPAFALNQDRWHASAADLRPCAAAQGGGR